MAISTVWSPYPNGGTGLNIRNAINTFNTNILADMVSTEARVTVNEGNISGNTAAIGTNTSDIAALDVRVTANEGDITTQDARIADLENTGLVVLNGNALAPQTIGTGATKVVLFSSKEVEAGVGAIGDVALDRAIATLDGIFKLRFEAFMSYASNVDITWRIYKNGSPFGNSITLAGQGAKVFPVTLITSTTLLADDYLELYASASASTNITISQVNGTLEKTHF